MYPDSPLPKVSVIIPTKDVESFLPGCIQSIRANSYPKELVEIVVIDNGSQDSSAEIAEKLADRFLLDQGTLGHIRNLAAEIAEGEILAFLDSDCLAEPDWLANAESTLRDSEIIITGSVVDIPADASWLERDWFAQRVTSAQEVPSINLGNMFVRKQDFKRLGGFNETLLTGEDTEFCSRAILLGKIVDNPSIRAIHLGNPKTLKEFLRREIWYGLGALGSFKNNIRDKPFLGTVVFLVGLILIVAALPERLMSGRILFGYLGLVFVFASPLAAVVYRRHTISSVGHALRLFLLYTIYFLGRTISLFYLALRRRYYHSIKQERIKRAQAIPSNGPTESSDVP